MDPQKIEAITKCPIPKNIKSLIRFLGLAGYYRKFLKNYAHNAFPLTSLLKKNPFIWNEEDTLALSLSKDAIRIHSCWQHLILAKHSVEA